MKFRFNTPKSMLSIATGGLSNLIPGVAEKQKSTKAPSVDTARKDEEKAADEAARKMRARDKLRSGVASSLSSGATASQFAATASNKPSLLG